MSIRKRISINQLNQHLSVIKIVLIVITFLTLPSCVFGAELLEKVNFFVDPSYDLQSREKIAAVLQRITDKLYFYLDANWWENLDIEKRKEVNIAIDDLNKEFESKIYPVLTSNFGSEWKPGIDGDTKITILIHPMIEMASGYFNTGDEYPLARVKTSNQREMIYLNSSNITSPLNKSFLAHELLHLITFNQKDKTYGISEETWLNEARAEYAPTLLGYDEQYQNSYLQNRLKIFIENPRESLTEWQGKTSDYGVANIFVHYLVDYYGKEILIDSLKSEKTGIPSLNAALIKNGFKDDFSQIFTNWTVAIFVNNCNFGAKYCYLNDNLKNLKITPFIYYLPTAGESTLSVGYLTKEWAGNWQKIIGGKESLKLDFTGSGGVNFKVPYIIEDSTGKISVKFLSLDQSQKGTLFAQDEKIISLTVIPSVQNKLANFTDQEPSYQFFWSVTTEQSGTGEQTELIKQLQARIEALLAQIAYLQAQLGAISNEGETTCKTFGSDLYYGMVQNLEVRCLQEFLKNQGQDVYPEGLITGNFLSLTQQAVIRFQEKYAAEILTPLGFQKGTGYVGPRTLSKINQLRK